MLLSSALVPAFAPARRALGCVVSGVAALTERCEIRVGTVAWIVVQVRFSFDLDLVFDLVEVLWIDRVQVPVGAGVAHGPQAIFPSFAPVV